MKNGLVSSLGGRKAALWAYAGTGNVEQTTNNSHLEPAVGPAAHFQQLGASVNPSWLHPAGFQLHNMARGLATEAAVLAKQFTTHQFLELGGTSTPQERFSQG